MGKGGEGGKWREGEGGQSKRLQVSVIKLLHSHVLVYKSQEAGKREGDTRAIRFFLLYLSPSPFFFSQVYNFRLPPFCIESIK